MASVGDGDEAQVVDQACEACELDGQTETPHYGARGVVALAADPDAMRFTGRTMDVAVLAREYGFTDLDGSQPDAWRYMVEVQDPGLPPDPTGYR